MTPVPLCRPQASQEGPPGDALRSPLLCPQPQALGQSILQAEMDCELHSSLQVCGPLPWAASGAGLVSFPVVGTTRAPAPRGPRSLAHVHRPQPLLPPVDAGLGGVLRRRSVSPSGLLDTTVSEEARQGPEEEREAQRPLPGGSGRRHTLAEVSAFSPCTPPCKCPAGRRAAW